MKAKITEVTFGKEWGKAPNKVYYYNILLEGQGDKTWNIGVKTQDPDFLTVGQTLEYEVSDVEKRKIKKVSAKLANNTPGGSGFAKGGFKKKQAPTVDPNSKSLIRHLDNFAEEDIIFIDIETARAVKELQKGTPLYEAWEYKNRYNNELERKTGEPVTLEEYFKDKAALYAAFAKVVTIVVGRVSGNTLKTKTYSMSKKDKWNEEPFLREFNDDVATILSKRPKTVFAGWANQSFDQPFLAKRMYTHDIQPNMLLDTAHLKPWEIPGFDLKELWKGTAFYPDSLLAAAVALGLPSPKSKMEGSEVGEAFYLGKIDDINEYCRMDVLTEANIYRKLAGKSILTLA